MKSKHLRKLGFIFLILLITLSGYMLFEINSDISSKSKWLNKIYKLNLINTNINTLISRNTGYYNYDHSKELIKELQAILEDIEKDTHLQSFFKSHEHANIHLELYKKIKNGFSQKTHFIHVFTSTNSILNHSLRFVTTLLTEMPQTSYQKRLIKLHSMLIQIGVGADSSFKEIEGLNSYLIKSLEKNYSLNLFLYTKHAKIIIAKFKRIEQLKKQNNKLNFEETISEFISHLQIHINEQISTLNNFMIALVAIIFAIIIFIILQLSKKMEQEAKLRTFKHAVENSDNSIIVTDKNHVVEYVNDSFTKISGFSQNDILGKTPSIIKSGLLPKEFYDELSQTIEKGQKWSGEFINKDSKGEICYEKATITPIFDADKNITKFIAIKLDVTADKLHQKEIEKKNVEIERRYYTDYLTGLGNRNLLMKKLNTHQVGRLFYININDYTELKTFYGMQNSDELLLKFATILQNLQKELNFETELFRIKSDEFCLWSLRDVKSPVQTMQIIYDYIMQQEFTLDSTQIKFDIAIGVSKDTNPKNKNRYSEAEIAHHMARHKGLNFMIYECNNEIENRYASNIRTIKLIQEAIETDNVTIYFQPIFNAKTGKVYMYESLVRIINKNSEVLTPFEFLDTAKQTNYYHKIMQIVIQKTFEMSNKNLDKKFSINFSNTDFHNELTQKVLINELINAKKPENIAIEILESENVQNYDILKEAINKIKKFGCLVSIDDFGSGHSNYYRLSQLDVDYIKIDGSIIKDLDKDIYSKTVIETIMTFAKKMNYPVVAEYVHSKKILDIIKSYDIEYAQGFYLGKPEATLL